MRYVYFLYCLILSVLLNAQDYEIRDRYVSQQVLENYLEHAITMQGLADVAGNVPTDQELDEEINEIINTKSKFIGRLAYVWSVGNPETIVQNTRRIVCQIKSRDPDIICQGAIFEYLNHDRISSIWIPSWVFVEFGMPVVNRKFNSYDMLYDIASDYYDENTPDMSQQETQMWFYFMARQYIDAGCEAIHFGQVHLMNRNDPGNAHWWSLLQRVRSYAATRYNQPLNCNSDIKHRGIVLCDAHTHGVAYNYGTQLLFDFHSFPLRMLNIGEKWGTGNGGDAELTTSDAACSGDPPIYGRSQGGQTYMGWSCDALPYMVEFDNAGNPDEPDDQLSSTGCTTWGWDEITWFGLQTESYRDQWLEYAYFRIKCMDEVGHLEMPGRREMTINPGTWPGPLYRAATGYHNQEEKIKELWNGTMYSFIDVADLYLDNGDLSLTNISPVEFGVPIIQAYSNFVSQGVMQVSYVNTFTSGLQYRLISEAEIDLSGEVHLQAGTEIHAKIEEVSDYCSNPVITVEP